MHFKSLFSLLALSFALTNGLRTKRATCPNGVDTAVNTQCCLLFPIVKDLKTNLFENECGHEAHGALRLIFHDAMGISRSVGGGGADGSIVVFNQTELTFPANTGIDDILAVMGPFIRKYSNVMTPGDFIQLAGAVSLTSCPGAPRIKFMLGRPQPVAASPPNLIPEPFDSVTTILNRFSDAGFSPQETVALISAHSIAGADNVDPSIPGTPFDSTPSIYDSQLFLEVLLRGTLFPGQSGQQGEVLSAIQGVLRLQSDFSLAMDPRTSCLWQSFVNDQSRMQSEFSAALFKMSLLGQNPSKMIDCSEVIPSSIPFTGPVRLPPGKTQSDIVQACASLPFPVISVTPGSPTAVPPIPQA